MTHVSPPAVAVDVWPLALDLGPEELEVLVGTLARDELERAARFRFRVDADRFIAGRGLLRRVLGRLTRTAPAYVRFEYGPFGKPALAGEPSLRFNLAHVGEVGVLAVAEGVDVGVDLELPRPGFGGLEIAEQFFCPQELSELTALPECERDAAFLRCWTRKEAYIKALGDGLQAELDGFAVSLAPGEPARLVWSRTEGECSRWTFDDISHVVPGALAAVCAEGGAIRVRMRLVGDRRRYR